MADEYNRESGQNDNAAKTLAIIGITLAVIALIWAMKADNRAGEAQQKALQSNSSQQRQ